MRHDGASHQWVQVPPEPFYRDFAGPSRDSRKRMGLNLSNLGQGMMRRAPIWLAALIVGLAAAAVLTSRTSTPPFLDAHGEVLPRSIAEERRVRLGGVEQYVLLRAGSNRAALDIRTRWPGWIRDTIPADSQCRTRERLCGGVLGSAWHRKEFQLEP